MVISKLAGLLDDEIAAGLARVRWRGRLEWVDTQWGTLLIDGAHNVQSARALRAFIETERKGRCVCWIVGFTQGKDIQGMGNELFSNDDIVIAAPFSQPQGMPWIRCVGPQEIRANIGSKVKTSSSLHEALANVINSDLNVVCGSLYLIADLFRLMNTSPFDI